ncbi:MAG: hypothetical protein V3T70_04005 [Phycisphaerae bacterium]
MRYFITFLLVGLVLTGIVLIRSARRHNRLIWGGRVCAGGSCRHRNKPDAQFCARCGRSMQDG